MKKITAVICILALILSLAGCQGQTEEQSNDGTATTTSEAAATEEKTVTLTGKVTAIDGAAVTLQLGELSENAGSSEMGNPPDMPNGEQDMGGGENGNPPDMPADGQGGGEAGGDPPDMPNGGQGGSEAGGNPPDMPGDNGPSFGGVSFTPSDETVTIDISEAVITVETADGTADGSISDISVDDILAVEAGEESLKAAAVIVKSTRGGQMGQPSGGFGGSGEVTQGSAANTIDTEGEYSDGTFTSTGDDENALRVVGVAVTLDGITVNKASGATSNTENGDFYGMNAALLATDGANVTIRNAAVNSSAQNGNGVFSYGTGTVVNIYDSVITTTADNSGGIQTTGGGTTNAFDLLVTTSGSSSAAIRSDRGGGTVNVDGGTYTSNGYNSPAVYSTADITVKNATLTANNSEALVIEGQNSITLENCDVTGNMSDTMGTSSDTNVHNVMIYQSMSGDADVGTSVFNMTGGSLTSNNGDMFYVTNTHCIITLSGVEITNNETDGYFLLASGNDASHGWGNAGSNGAQVEFTADGQSFEGDIAVDTISTLSMALTNNSIFTGTVNIITNAQNGTAAASNADITIDSGSVWNLTGDCTVTSLTNNGTINFNGHTITLADGTVLSD